MKNPGTKPGFAVSDTHSAIAELGKEAEDLDVEPDHFDQEAVGAVPLHVLGSTRVHAFFDDLEGDDQVEGGHDDTEDAEADADETAGAVDGVELPEPTDVDAEEREAHGDQADEGDAESAGEDHLHHGGADADEAEGVGGEEATKDAEGDEECDGNQTQVKGLACLALAGDPDGEATDGEPLGEGEDGGEEG